MLEWRARVLQRSSGASTLPLIGKVCSRAESTRYAGPESTEVLSELERTGEERLQQSLVELRERGGTVVRFSGDSMAPRLNPGDCVHVERVSVEAIAPGHIVAFTQSDVCEGEILVLHRVVRVYEQDGERWLVTKGDALPGVDVPLRAADVLGRVAAVYSLKGWADSARSAGCGQTERRS